jgi:hypothetical protein
MTTTSNEERRVVKFTTTGMKSDISLKVFNGLEFHVYSGVLKLYSSFFRRFLDSLDKIVPTSPVFPHEWATRTDDDRNWHLISADRLVSI